MKGLYAETSPPQINLLGLPFHPVDLESAATLLIEKIEVRQRCFVSTPNLNFTMLAQQNADFYHSVLHSDLVVADGMPLVWVAKFLGLPIKQRVAGSDLFNQLSTLPRHKKLRIFFFGGEAGIAEKAHNALNAHSVGMLSCGFYDPGFISVDEMSTEAIRDIINYSQADFLVVALGAQKGQQWIMQNQAYLNTPVISHLGAVINFVAGNVSRAPQAWQKMGLEWLWRIKQEPKLYKRYLIDGVDFIKLLITNVLPLKLYSSCWLCHKRVAKENVEPVLCQTGGLQLSHKVTTLHLQSLERCLATLLAAKGDVYCEGRQLQFMDASVIARLSVFQAQLTMQGRKLFLKNFSKKSTRLLRFSSVLKHFTLI